MPHHALIARLKALPPFRLDALLGVLVLGEATVEVIALTSLTGTRLLAGIGVSGLVALAIALRRRATIAAVAVGWSALLLADQVGRGLTDNTPSLYFGNMFVTFTAGYVLAGRQLWGAGTIGVALTILSTALGDFSDSVGNYLMSAGLGVVGPMLLGQILRSRTQLNQALREKTARLERDRSREAEQAALEERTRIAGELHDVVAHALSAMTIQAAAARRLAARDPEHARAAFARAEETGREALTELRRLLGVLRREDEDIALAPQPSLAHVADLVRRTAAAGLPTELRTEGEPRPLPAGVDLTAYRLVQEALEAAREVGRAGRASVAVRYRDADVTVEVADDGLRTDRRLLGMRERVAVYGGELTTASVAAGGWAVAARLPLEATG